MRLILTILGVLAAMAAGAFGLFYVFIAQPINRAMAPATPQNARVDLLAEKPDAVILMPFVTGDEPRLVRGETLQRLAPQLWFTSTTEAGNVVGAVMFGMMGLPPLREIATTFREGAPLKEHTCLTIGCMHWATAQPQMWGMGRLKGMGDALGPKVEKHREAFSDHAAYLKVHAAVRADRRRWFTSNLGYQPQPPPDGMRQVTISLPTRIVRARVDGSPPREDTAIKLEVEALARALLDATGGSLQSVAGITPLPFWAEKDGQYLRTSDGATRALPDISLLRPSLTLSVPEARAERVAAAARQKTRADAWLPPNPAMIDQAIARAFRLWGIDASCLPDCGSATPAQPVEMTSEVSIGAPPSWALEYWLVPLARIP
jgi:hypothetical protein